MVWGGDPVLEIERMLFGPTASLFVLNMSVSVVAVERKSENLGSWILGGLRLTWAGAPRRLKAFKSKA
jgi:hypothetical protein